MSCMPDMTPTSLEAAVAPRTRKIIKNLLYYVKAIVRNRVTKLESTQTKLLALKGLTAMFFF